MFHLEYDVLVIGGGIAGQETALNLGEMGFKVILIEKEASIGGKMILLSKVFPTLDCASCIATPKMSETMRNENIEVLSYSEVMSIERIDKKFKVKIIKKPKYVREDLCTGCQECEANCPVNVEDQFNFGLVGRRAVYIPFSTAIPKTAVIDIENCILCGVCERVCPANAIDFTQEPETYTLKVKAVVLATGFNLFPARKKLQFGFGRFPNVMDAMEMDRLLSPTRPYNAVIRPLDGKIPENIAYVLCTGSRDVTVGNPLCSQICCMYSIKQAQLLMGALPLADITIYYIDIRAFGKGFEEFYQQAKNMGVQFVKGKVAKIEEIKETGNLVVRYEDVEGSGGVKEAEHDLVVLSVGMLANPEATGMFKFETLELDEFNYVKQVDPLLNPAKTNLKGVFAAGTATGPKDIPDSILSAGAASAEVAAYIRSLK